MTADPDLARLCPGCFADKGAANPCPHCGFDEQAARPAQALALRTLLNGQFVIGRVLGKPGGFGITYLGWDRQLQTPVAIKEYLPRDLAVRAPDGSSILPHTAEEDGLFRYGLEQFLAEARTLARMDHPNIVRVRHFFEANRSAYLVMDYYRGLSLAEHLERSEQRGDSGRISERNALTLMQPILDGLRAVHAKGFLHRDVKPQNIYLARTDSGGVRPILLDFGAARQAVGERSRSLSVVISPGYAPFEQYHRKGAQGPPTDIYGAAAVLYRMLTGETPPEATERMADDSLKPAVAFGVSQAVSDALAQGLAMSPAARPQTVQAFQAKLLGAGAASERGSVSASVASVPPPAPAPAPLAARPEPPALPVVKHPSASPAGPASAKRRWLGAVVAALMVLGLGGWYQYQQGQIEAQSRKAADDRAFQTALGTNTDAAYRAYLSACAADGCGHRSQAEQRLRDLAAEAQAEIDRMASERATQERARQEAERQAAAEAKARAEKTQAEPGPEVPAGPPGTLPAPAIAAAGPASPPGDADRSAYAAAKAADTVDSYQAYLAHCPPHGCAYGAKVQLNLGEMYEQGRGVAQDDRQAVQWYRKAAEQGDAVAQTSLGLMYVQGRGVPQDDRQAVQWYRKAAEQGDAGGQDHLGLMYALGRGVAQDYRKAVQWYRKAAEQGYVDAQFNLGVMYAGGRGVARDDRKAVQWWRKAAEQGFGAAQHNLGVMYREGRGAPKDEGQAVQWFEKAADQGLSEAQDALDELRRKRR